MSQVNRSFRVLAAGCALLAALAVGCSKKNGAPFDPDAGHPDNYITTHPDAYRSTDGACTQCHGGDLLGGISTVSCYSASRDGQSCHAAGPGGHPPGWRALHSATNPDQAATCAACHQSKPGTPGCFNNTLCHGPKSGHPSGWLSSHTGTNPNQAATCAACHQSNPGTPGCFNNTLCHGAKAGPHPNGWLAGSQHGKTAEAAPGGASGMAYCSSCHGFTFGGGNGRSCLTCHGGNAPHPKSNWAGESGRHRNVNTGNTQVCARCHPQLAGSSNCRNTNGCHGGD
jgi:hypothetical protein